MSQGARARRRTELVVDESHFGEENCRMHGYEIRMKRKIFWYSKKC